MIAFNEKGQGPLSVRFLLAAEPKALSEVLAVVQSRDINIVQESLPMEIFDYKYWNEKLNQLSTDYQTDKPFPHIILEDFLPKKVALAASKEYSLVDWSNYIHFNENKQAGNPKSFPATLNHILNELNSSKFYNL